MKVEDSSTGQPYSTLQLIAKMPPLQFRCFTSFLASSVPMTAALTQPPQYYPAQLTGLRCCLAVLLLCYFRVPCDYLLSPTKPIFRTHSHKFSHIPPSRPRTELESSKFSGQHFSKILPKFWGSCQKAQVSHLSLQNPHDT